MGRMRNNMLAVGVYVVLLTLAYTALAEDAPPSQAGEAPSRERQEAPAVPREEPIEPEHAKINTDDAAPVDPGHFELELGYSFTRAKRQWDDKWSEESRGLTREHAVELGLTYGLVENLDVGLGMGYADLYDRDSDLRDGGGVTDLGVGLKWRFYHNEDLKLSLAYLPGLTLPVGRESDSDRLGPSQEFWSLDQKLALSKDWGRWTANADVGYSLPFGGKRGDARGTLESNLAVGYQLYDWLQPEVELNYAHDFVHKGHDSDLLAVTAGLVMPLSDRWRASVGVQQAIAGRNADRGTTGMFSLTFMW